MRKVLSWLPVTNKKANAELSNLNPETLLGSLEPGLKKIKKPAPAPSVKTHDGQDTKKSAWLFFSARTHQVARGGFKLGLASSVGGITDIHN